MSRRRKVRLPNVCSNHLSKSRKLWKIKTPYSTRCVDTPDNCFGDAKCRRDFLDSIILLKHESKLLIQSGRSGLSTMQSRKWFQSWSRRLSSAPRKVRAIAYGRCSMANLEYLSILLKVRKMCMNTTQSSDTHKKISFSASQFASIVSELSEGLKDPRAMNRDHRRRPSLESGNAKPSTCEDEDFDAISSLQCWKIWRTRGSSAISLEISLLASSLSLVFVVLTKNR